MKAAKADTGGNETREAILIAALQAFAEKGFDAASTRDIASRAGVNHGLIPYYFGGKPNLWKAAVDRAFAQLEAGIAVALGDSSIDDETDRARLLVRNYVRFVARHPEFVLLMHEEGKRKGPRMRWLVDRHVKPMYESVAELMRRATAQGLLPPDVPPIHFHYILAGSVGLIFHQAEECKRLVGIDPFDESTVENHVRAVEYMFFGPPKEEKPQ
jgi:TetR/AcrR family transcriptional regulator